MDSAETLQVLGAIAAVAVALRYSLRRRVPAARFGDAYVTIMEHEANSLHVMALPPTRTITIFPHLDVPALAARTAAIVAANPWLLGRMVSAADKTVELQYATSPTNVEAAFAEMTCPLPADASTDDVMDWLTKSIAPTMIGRLCLDDPSARLFQVVAVHLANGSTGVAVALCHSIGDGDTFYTLYKMLDAHEKAQSLTPTRAFYNGTPAFRHWAPYTTRSAFMGLRVLINALLYGYRKALGMPPHVARYRVNLEAVAAAKAAHTPTPSAPFLSTNDILTSAFFAMTQTSLGLMSLNLRDRLGLSSTDAGNYIIAFTYTASEYASPANIRASNSDKRAPQRKTASTADAVPGALAGLFGGKLSVITNWCSFYHHLVLEDGVHPLSHAPLVTQGLLPFDATAVLYNHSPTDVRLAVTRNASTPLLPSPLLEPLGASAAPSA
ncbi:hypothetical protein SPRG_15294 [Saprolegnia parasitica CBS 223.65]|uniref:Condensation domain-containing protein n=1 Tax=Saprolegnia parasitica (strain CBS 223.65) TaxID=695850 RepID=A0A067BMN5_SAPPC|nr:hypothetical protein SPRG_15294 [Saprolegnia parasitica CBS 223.65]KDO19488.1 hypothetical protein SPRG_15294 [Saprolegnia parasitica CBS 223.65]|eukprot:XP_012209792.1 hypothetical protein SPRG_15294 [Saprolegnia parasitica CBS 223.65]